MLVPSHKPPKLLEREVTGQIREFMKLKGWRPVRMQRTVMPGQFQTGEPGIPDFVFLKYLKCGIAAVLWVEMKRPGKKLRPAQEEWMQKELRLFPLALAWTVDAFDDFQRRYYAEFGWLHDGRLPGQIELFRGAMA